MPAPATTHSITAVSCSAGGAESTARTPARTRLLATACRRCPHDQEASRRFANMRKRLLPAGEGSPRWASGVGRPCGSLGRRREAPRDQGAGEDGAPRGRRRTHGGWHGRGDQSGPDVRADDGVLVGGADKGPGQSGRPRRAPAGGPRNVGQGGVRAQKLPREFVQRGYLALEKQGKVYRIDPNVLPTKFMNATLNLEEVRKMPLFCAICGTVHEKIILVYQGRLGTKIG